MPTNLSNNRETSDEIANFSDYVNTYVLTAGVNNTITVPAGTTLVQYRRVIFSGNITFLVKKSSTPFSAVPSADVTDGTGGIINPAGPYLCAPGDVFQVISSTGGIVSAAFYTQD